MNREEFEELKTTIEEEMEEMKKELPVVRFLEMAESNLSLAYAICEEWIEKDIDKIRTEVLKLIELIEDVEEMCKEKE